MTAAMKLQLRTRRFAPAIALDGADERLVERPAPGAAPTAFRIWAAGQNMSDDGPDVFSRRSAEMLMTEQAVRGNLYSLDFDHLSLKSERPAEAGRAAGWHKLAVRSDENGEPELWAVDVDWCADVREGLEESPPRWRYFSPAFDIDTETREIVSYVNTALCINPKTWNNNQLAARRAHERGSMAMAMTKAQREKLAVLNAMAASMSAEDGDDETKAAAAAMYKAAGGSDAHEELKKCAEGEPGEQAAEGDGPPKSGEEPEASARAEGDDEDEDDEKKKEAARAAAADEAATRAAAGPAARAQARGGRPDGDDPYLMKTLAKMTARVDALEKRETERREQSRKDRVAKVLDTRKDIAPTLRAQLLESGLRPTQIQAIVDAIPRTNAMPPKAGAATRGADQGKAGPTVIGGVAIPESVSREVEKAMRIPPPPGPVTGFGEVVNGRRVFHTRRPTEWRAMRAREQAGQLRTAAEVK